MIRYATGDATDLSVNEPKILAHIVNDRGGWGKGFVLAVSKRWARAESEYRLWARSPSFALGAVQYVQVRSDLHVANMVAQSGYKTKSNPTPLCHDHLATCLKDVAEKAKALNASIHMPRIGTGLAGSSWLKIEPLLEAALGGLDVTVYDFG